MVEPARSPSFVISTGGVVSLPKSRDQSEKVTPLVDSKKNRR